MLGRDKIPVTRFFGVFHDPISVIQNALYEKRKFAGKSVLLDNEPQKAPLVQITLMSMFLRAYAFSPSKGTSIELENEEDFDLAFFTKIFLGLHPDASPIKNKWFNGFAMVLRVPFNSLKLATEFLPGAIHHLLDDFLFKWNLIKEPERPTAASNTRLNLSNYVSALRTYRIKKAFSLMASGIFILPLWAASIAIYNIGRAITSPVESMQAALHFVSDDFNNKNPIRSTLITLPLVLGSLAITAVSITLGSMFAAQALAATNAFSFIAPYVAPIGESVASLINIPAITGLLGGLGLNLGLAAAPFVGIGAAFASATMLVSGAWTMIASVIDYDKHQAKLNEPSVFASPNVGGAHHKKTFTFRKVLKTLANKLGLGCADSAAQSPDEQDRADSKAFGTGAPRGQLRIEGDEASVSSNPASQFHHSFVGSSSTQQPQAKSGVQLDQ